jgi:hypothetical protein
MVILEEPYVSKMLIAYLKENNVPVLKNHFSEQFSSENLNIKSEVDFIKAYKDTNKIYTVSENGLNWANVMLNDFQLNRQIKTLKNKSLFRELCSTLYPNFFFKEVSLANLVSLDISTLKYPFVLKPTVGFLSAGVFVIFKKEDWDNALETIQDKFKSVADKFSELVISDSSFIIESYIEGKEFAIDLYFNAREPVVINIFEHPFSSEKDVSDRLYFTNKQIYDEYLYLFTSYMRKLNKVLKLKNIPVHIELRITNDEIIPIEINPLRFAGMCLNEIGFYITGKHPLHYYFTNTTPNYVEMWKGKENETFSFSIIEKILLKDRFSCDLIKQIYSNILEFRNIECFSLGVSAFVFSRTKDKKELDKILRLDSKNNLF